MIFSTRREVNYLMTSLALDLGYSAAFVKWQSNYILCNGFTTYAKELHQISGDVLSWMEGYSTYQMIGQGTKVPFCLLDFPTDLDTIQATHVYRLRQLCLFLSKASDLGQTYTSSEVAKEFLSYQAKDECVLASVDEDPLLELSATIIGSIFDDSVPLTGHGRFGPGSVYGVEFSDRYSSAFRQSSDAHSLFHNDMHFLASMDRLRSINHWDLFFPTRHLRSEFLLVPKDIRGPRTICRETVESMYGQQALRDYMERSIMCSSAGGFVNFSDQSVNGRLALESSGSLEFATIDLKDASDRVSYALVHRLFKYCPQLWNSMLNVRSRHVDCAGRSFAMRKWAPMGSAICFTTLSIAVYALIKAGLALLGIDVTVYVYGDDLVVPTRYAVAVMQILENYGLEVSERKSFVRSKFRESCGVDAYDGVDVTPAKLRFLPTITSFKETSLASFCSTIHQLDALKLYRTATYLFTLCKVMSEMHGGEGILPGDVTSPYLSAPLRYFDGVKLKRKKVYNKKLHRLEYLYRGYVVADRMVDSKETPTDAFYRTVAPSLIRREAARTDDVKQVTDIKSVSVRDTVLIARRITTLVG